MAEHDVGGTGRNVELHGVAAGAPGGSGEHDQAGDVGVCEEHINEVLSQIGRANQADVKSHGNSTPGSLVKEPPW